MDHSTHFSGRRAVPAAEVLTLVGFVLYVVLPDAVWGARAAVMVLGGLAVVVCAGVWLRQRRVHLATTVVAAASALGLVGAVAYLHSLADEPSAIPLGGVGVLALSLVGMVVTTVMLATGTEDSPSR